MTNEEFELSLVRYGTKINDWPSDLHEAAMALLQESESARDLYGAEIRAQTATSAIFRTQRHPRIDTARIVQNITGQRDSIGNSVLSTSSRLFAACAGSALTIFSGYIVGSGFLVSIGLGKSGVTVADLHGLSSMLAVFL